jgi:hypothetical protein
VVVLVQVHYGWGIRVEPGEAIDVRMLKVSLYDDPTPHSLPIVNSQDRVRGRDHIDSCTGLLQAIDLPILRSPLLADAASIGARHSDRSDYMDDHVCDIVGGSLYP